METETIETENTRTGGQPRSWCLTCDALTEDADWGAATVRCAGCNTER